MEGCVVCGRRVDPVENWIKCHLWAAFGVFHWRCFSEYLREQSEEEVENLMWRASRLS